jgi:hypothetical protein
LADVSPGFGRIEGSPLWLWMELQPEKDCEIQCDKSGEDPEFIFHAVIMERRAQLCL